MTSAHIVTGTTPSTRVGGETLDTVLHWTPEDPLRVHVTWRHPDGVYTRWAISRELLRDGMMARAGRGDLVVTPAGDRLHLTLRARSAESETVSMDMGRVRRMLIRTHLMVPIGMEDIDVQVAVDGAVTGTAR
jgi:hypothetical protein